jgi:hypothetical protein
MLNRAWKVAAVLLLVAAPALAQDSVSNNLGGLPGDALSPWSTTQQCANYVVDLTSFTTSWGTEFGIAPLVKGSKSNLVNFNSLLSAQSLSRLHALGVPFPTASYAFWTQPGRGVNTATNEVPGSLAPTGTSNQFAAVFAEFGTTVSAASYNAIVGAIANYKASEPNRLYVHRVLAASNGLVEAENRAQFGIGAVDELGNIAVRADAGSSTSPNYLTGNNYYTIGLLARSCGTINYIDGTGMADAGAGLWVLQKNATNYNTPNLGPASKFGVPTLLGTNFNKEYAYGAATLALTTTHRPGTFDQRGCLAYTTRNVAAITGTHGTAALIAKSTATGNPSNQISLFGLTAGGAVGGTKLLTLPTVLTDPQTGFTTNDPNHVFTHYWSQTAYRGGNSQVALNVDQQGRLLVAAVTDELLYTATNFYNNLVVCRIDASGNTQWSVVAYSADATWQMQTGKAILNGPGGAVIGHLDTMYDVTGGTPQGPSMSAPMIDAVGNIWFLAAAALNKVDHLGVPYIDTDTVLIRAVYDPATLGYQLELVLEVGSVFQGQNSGVPWQIGFLGIADSNSIDSGTAYSANISETGYKGAAPAANLPTVDPKGLGGLVLNASIVYDVNSDGKFNDPTSSHFDPNYPADEAYASLLYLSAYSSAPPVCVGDLNCDGVVSFADINPFVQYLSAFPAWQTANPSCLAENGDINGDGVYGQGSFGDINPFVAKIVNCASQPGGYCSCN